MNQLAILKWNDKVISAVLEEDNLTEVFADDEKKSFLIGNVYIAKVKNIIKNINAAFVDIGENQMCYLPYSEGTFKNGEEVVVQISKDGVKTKQPTVTTKLTFTGCYVVLIKGEESAFSISGKITDKEERERLFSLESRMRLEHYQIILRTNCIGVSEDVILAEYEIMEQVCERIEKKGKTRTCYSLLYEALPPYLTYIRDTKRGELDRIITDDKEIYENIMKYFDQYQLEEMEIPELYEDADYSLNHLLGIESKLRKALNKKVWLSSGGSLIIEPTEALTVIDVNTDKAVKGNRNPETTYFKLNLEAAKEIAKQLRIRNISGIIIVDFIDMKRKENRSELLRKFRVELGKDKIKTVLVDMTPLGLVEITRMKKKKPLHEQLL